MSVRSRTTQSFNSGASSVTDFTLIDDWLASVKNDRASAVSQPDSELHGEIHLAITELLADYATSLCDQLFTLYRDVQLRPFVLQFLPSFITAYYDVLHHHHSSSSDATAKDICSTIDTFLVGLYNLGVLDGGHDETVQEFRIPNLTLSSIYHIPNPDHYAPTPLTQHTVSKHEKKCDVIRLQSFTPFDTVNATIREQILWFLLIQYGSHVSSMDRLSRQAYFQMSKKLLAQGFSFDETVSPAKSDSMLHPTGRRIQISSRLMTEILGTLFYFKANSKAKEASECMRLLKKRAEYEMYADVILMTESMSYLHEFENQRPEQQDTIGIEIELPPTVDMVRQKRAATTARSMKNRQHSRKHHHTDEIAIVENDLPNDTIEHLTFVPAPSDASPTRLTPPTSHRHRSILDVLDENTPTSELLRSTSTRTSSLTGQPDESSLASDRPQVESGVDTPTNIASSIGPASSSSSPTSTRQFKPLSLTSTQAYFKTIQQQRASSPNSQNVQTIVYHEADLSRSHSSSMKQGDRKDTLATVRFVGTDENRTNAEETYL